MTKGKRCSNPVTIKDNDDPRFCNPHKQMFGLIPRGSSNYGKAAKAERRKQQQEERAALAAKKAAEAADVADNTASAGTPTSSAAETPTVEGETKSGSRQKKNDPGSTVYPSNRPSQRKRLTAAQRKRLNREVSTLGDETDSEDEFVVKKKAKRTYKRRKTKAGASALSVSDRHEASETDSDLSDVEEDVLLFGDLDDPLEYTRRLRRVEVVSEEEALHLRRERIQQLLHLYHMQYRQLRYELSAKYNEFLRQRNAAASRLLMTAGKFCSTKVAIEPTEIEFSERDKEDHMLEESKQAVNIQMRTIETHSAASERERLRQLQQQIDAVRRCGPIQRPDRSAPTFSRIEKSHISGKPLCVFSNCTQYRMLLSEFCSHHILYDPNQRLYTTNVEGDFSQPVLVLSDVTLGMSPAQARDLDKSNTATAKKIVSIEGRRRSMSSSGRSNARQRATSGGGVGGGSASTKTRALELAGRLKETISRLPTISSPTSNPSSTPSLAEQQELQAPPVGNADVDDNVKT